ncbi:glycosyltransferase [uncultured Thiodictyon sp.]|jgi:glycosyltransferase involved in cell wall biosynthesis|uniref:glycosyltransferase n=1 Tax=uncultured Thiodictyon sp. TaxID=1846217 RepID=UPI0025D21BCC|nr:glycosyltransferase [uncultured Thiodictyon sp.]
MNPHVSVIVPCYNQGRYLAEALDSLIAQTYTEWECLVVDDGSSDNTQDVARVFESRDARFRYMRQRNKGPSAARNAGIAASRGALIQFLDADDLLLPEKISLHARYLTENPGVAVVYSDFAFFSDNPVRVYRESPEIFGHKCGYGSSWLALLSGNFIVVQAALTRREAIVDVGGFEESFRTCEDYLLWLRLAGRGGIFAHLGGPLALYRQGAPSASSNEIEMHRGTIRAMRVARTLRILNSQEALTVREHLRSLHTRIAVMQVEKHSVFNALLELIFAARSDTSIARPVWWALSAAIENRGN